MAGTGGTNNNNDLPPNNLSTGHYGLSNPLQRYRVRSVGPTSEGQPLERIVSGMTAAQQRKLMNACALGSAVCAGLVATVVAAASAALAASIMRGGTRKAKKSNRKRRATRSRKH